MPGAGRALLLLPALAVLGWMGMLAVAHGRASVMAVNASQEMDKVTLIPADPSSWGGILASLETALSLDPGNPGIQELLGVLKSRRSDREDYSREAVVHFTRALEQRPSSPYSWASLVRVNYELGGGGKQLEALIVRSTLLGPAEPAIQRTVADVGLAVWREVGVEGKSSIERMVSAGIRRNPLEILQISERRGRLEVACRNVSGIARPPEASWSKFCQSTEATP